MKVLINNVNGVGFKQKAEDRLVELNLGIIKAVGSRQYREVVELSEQFLSVYEALKVKGVDELVKRYEELAVKVGVINHNATLLWDVYNTELRYVDDALYKEQYLPFINKVEMAINNKVAYM